MAAIAPMLETLGYDPNDNEPNYEKVSLKSYQFCWSYVALLRIRKLGPQRESMHMSSNLYHGRQN